MEELADAHPGVILVAHSGSDNEPSRAFAEIGDEEAHAQDARDALARAIGSAYNAEILARDDADAQPMRETLLSLAARLEASQLEKSTGAGEAPVRKPGI